MNSENTDKKPTVTIFVATLNEIDAVRVVLPKVKAEWYDELLIVDGCSTDGTPEWLKENGYTVLNQEEKGIASAHAHAFNASTGDFFIAFYPDGNCLPERIPDLIKTMNEGYDLVCVSRFLPPAKTHNPSKVRRFGNYMFTKIINILFGANYTDVLGGFRGYRRDAVERMGLSNQSSECFLREKYDLLNTWELGSVMRAAKLNLSTIDIPGEEPKRIGGESKVSIIKNGIMIVMQILYELLTGNRYLK